MRSRASWLLVCCGLLYLPACGSRSALLSRLWDGGEDRPPDRPLPAPGWSQIPPGTFVMGSPKSEACRNAGTTRETQHQVTLSVGFRIGTTEVTQKQYRERRNYNPASFSSCGDSCPVELVNWHEAAAYCNALSEAEALPLCYSCTGTHESVECHPSASYADHIVSCPGYRLPTEAEWEYAYRAGTTTAYYNGSIGSDCDDDPHAAEIGWYLSTAGSTTHPAGQKLANAWGLVDMAGNVWEWCHDGYKDDLGAAAVTDPQGWTSSASKVLRGSSWLDTAGHLRAADRFGHPPGSRNSNIGFRCARSE